MHAAQTRLPLPLFRLALSSYGAHIHYLSVRRRTMYRTYKLHQWRGRVGMN